MERQIQEDVRGSAHITHIAQQRLHAHCLQMIVKAQWTPDSPNLNSLETSCLEAMHEAFLKASSEAKNSF